jgi:hypothetical protein
MFDVAWIEWRSMYACASEWYDQVDLLAVNFCYGAVALLLFGCSSHSIALLCRAKQASEQARKITSKLSTYSLRQQEQRAATLYNDSLTQSILYPALARKQPSHKTAQHQHNCTTSSLLLHNNTAIMASLDLLLESLNTQDRNDRKTRKVPDRTMSGDTLDSIKNHRRHTPKGGSGAANNPRTNMSRRGSRRPPTKSPGGALSTFVESMNDSCAELERDDDAAATETVDSRELTHDKLPALKSMRRVVNSTDASSSDDADAIQEEAEVEDMSEEEEESEEDEDSELSSLGDEEPELPSDSEGLEEVDDDSD